LERGAALKALRETHEQLAVYYGGQQSTEQRTVGPIYFADHGFTADEREAVRNLVRSGLQCKPLGSFDWSSAYLPLLVCAIEVGYYYEGNGTDFWPLLSNELQHDFDGVRSALCA